MRKCKVEGCDRSADRRNYGYRGWCSSHYQRWLRHGDPLHGGTPKGDAQQFVKDALTYTGDECILWPYSKKVSGYGQVFFDGKMHLASRYVCKRAHGEPPTPEHEAAHSCGNGSLGCITPSHLSWKTSAENTADQVLHGTLPRGERNGQSKLTDDDVRQILALKGRKSHRDIAEYFGISPSNVSAIHCGRSWLHLREGINS